jgi:3-deoxy-D-manno-octulosonate 8-phosphate phosphatase (KDO 8-P phosphatase)
MKLLILDVDGVLTSGLKAYDTTGNVVSKEFGDRDFTAIKEFVCAGIRVVFLSGDQQVNSQIAQLRCIPFFYSRRATGNLSKSECAIEIQNKYGHDKSETIFVGDDLFDVEMRAHAAFVACPSNGHYKMKEVSDLILNTKSGQGCVQELFEYFVKKQLIVPAELNNVVARDSSEFVKY